MSPDTARITSVVAGVGLLFGGATFKPMYDYLVHTPTPREELIGGIILDAFHEEAKVVCLPPDELVQRKFFRWGSENPDGYTSYGWPPLVWLTSDKCATFEQFANRNPAETLSLTPEEMLAIKTVAHESRHLAGIVDESRAECEAVQVAYKIPQVLGATEITSYMVGDTVANAMWEKRKGGTSEYADLSECRPGGEFDLGLPAKSFPSLQR